MDQNASNQRVATLLDALAPYPGHELHLEAAIRRTDWHAVLSHIPKTAAEAQAIEPDVERGMSGGLSPRWEAFAIISPYLSDVEYWTLLGRVWVETEKRVTSEEVMRLFVRSGRNVSLRSSTMDRVELAMLDSLPASFPLFRGGSGDPREYWAWTLSPEIARDFAQTTSAVQMGGEPEVASVHQATCSRHAVVALFLRKGECEIIVDPSTLVDLSVFESFQPTDPPGDAYEALSRAKEAAQRRTQS